MPKRVFIALELPLSCREALSKLDPRIKGVRWVPVGKMHLTLGFLGSVEAEPEERLKQALAEVQVTPFFLPVKGIGAFGGAQPTVVWAGVGNGHPHLFALHKRIQDAVLHAGLEADLTPFRPHITVARTKGVARVALLPFLRRHAEAEICSWKVTGFALFSSLLSPDGAIYSLEMRREFQ